MPSLTGRAFAAAQTSALQAGVNTLTLKAAAPPRRAIGTLADIVSRLQLWLPSRWFPAQAFNSDGTVPRVYAQLVSWATPFAAVWQQIQYTRNQTRLSTSTDGWLDLAGYDYFGGGLPRNPGELDAAYAARIQANLFLPANTRSALANALATLTGNPVRMIEPWQPHDTARWGAFFWGYDTAVVPGQWANGNQRYAGLIECTLPLVSGTGSPRFGWGNFFWAYSAIYATASGAWWSQFNAASPTQLVYAALDRLRAAGTSIYLKFVMPPAPAEYLATDSGKLIETDGGQYIEIAGSTSPIAPAPFVTDQSSLDGPAVLV